MDFPYDHIQEEALPKEEETTPKTSQEQQTHPTLNDDLQEAYKAISTSAWGASIGSFFGNVVKQGEHVYREAQQEFNVVSGEAQTRFSGLREAVINRTRSLSLTTPTQGDGAHTERGVQANDGEDRATTPTDAGSSGGAKGESMLSRLQAEAAKRLKDIQRAEDAADEALLKFGTNIRDFLQNAITIAPPGDDSTKAGASNQVLFESKDAHGKRVIHTSRFDAQLHVIHTSVDGFSKDPDSEGFAEWRKEFDVEKKTGDISADLAKYPDLRATMEKLVPDQIPYAEFWTRYYFLRHSVETAEAKRRDLLKAVSADDDMGWGDDSDDEATTSNHEGKRPNSTGSSTTIQAPAKAGESRKSNDEKSQADSDASYDVVGAMSGNPSQAPNSPKDSKRADDSDEDWE